MMPLNPLAIKCLIRLGIIALIAAGLAAAIWAIDHNGYKRAAAHYQQKIDDEHAALKKAADAAQNAAQARSIDQFLMLNASARSIVVQNQTIATLGKKLKEQGHAASTQYRPQPNSALEPIPNWLVTHGWVCSYNSAIASGDPVPEAGTIASGAKEQACQADAFGVSAITAEQIISHHIDYAGYCRAVELQRDALLNYLDFLQDQK